MSNNTANDFFKDIDYTSIIDTVKGIFTSDGSISTLLDFERCLDEADLYAYKNWELGELVDGPAVKKYTVTCMFMYPYKLMPDPRGAKRLISVGCVIKFKKTKIKVPVKIENYDDFQPGGKYPKMAAKKVWLVSIQMPIELMNDIRQGSVDLADQTIDLDELDDSYDEDLDKDDNMDDEEQGDLGGVMPQMAPPPAAPAM